VEKIFPNESICVEIITKKVVKSTKNVRDELHVQVYKNGMETEFSTLSGGEYDRMTLVFTLILLEMLNTPFVLLDEPTSSLDQATADTVFNFLKTQLADKLVIVIAHQVVAGIFHTSINLE
jgi:ABC-type transport system involved in cytochrome bd biosynthesis fused ATPase/permease subunit